MDYSTTRIYLGGPLFTPKQVEVLTSIEDTIKLAHIDAEEATQRRLSIEIFHPKEESKPIWNGRPPKDCSPAERFMVFQGNARHVVWSDLLIAWVGGMDEMKALADGSPAPSDTGVVWEMGLAYGVNVPTVAYIDPEDGRQEMNIMLSNSVNAVAHGTEDLQEILAEFMATRNFDDKFHPLGRVLEEAGA